MNVSRICTHILSMAVLAVIAASCVDDLKTRDIFPPDGENAVLSFSVDGRMTVRSEAADERECRVDHAYLLFFTAGQEDGQSFMTGFARASVSDDFPDRLSFHVPSGIKEGESCHVLAVANADCFPPDGYENYSEFLSSLLESDENVSLETARENISLRYGLRMTADDPEVFPMTGEIWESTVFKSDNGGYNISGSLLFRRSVCRIDVTNLAVPDFVMTGVCLCNYRTDAVPFGEDSEDGDVCGVSADEFSESEFVGVDEPDDKGLQLFRKGFYCFPNVTRKSGQNDHLTTALLIAGRYRNPATGHVDDAVSYYRVNVGVNGSAQNLVANSIYRIVIGGVKGRGKNTPEEAYEETSPLLSTFISQEWDASEESCVTDDNGNYIVLSKARMYVAADQTSKEEIRVLTSKGLVWDIEPVEVALCGDGSPAFGVSRVGDANCFVASAYFKNTKDPERKGVFRLTGVNGSDSLSICFSIIQEGSAPFFYLTSSDTENVDVSGDEISIQSFRPELFNTFCHAPFTIHLNPEAIGVTATDVGDITVEISTDLKWPMEGMAGTEMGTGRYEYYSLPENSGGKDFPSRPAGNRTDGLKDNDVFYISAGCMGPDDPDIEREIRFTVHVGDKYIPVDYKLRLYVKPVIIDDVILKISDEEYWMVCDRNVQIQDASSTSKLNPPFPKYGPDENGKHQAYHYGSCENLKIPNKLNEDGKPASDHDLHREFAGYLFTDGNTIPGKIDPIITDWRNLYRDKVSATSPFYASDNISEWVCPSIDMLTNVWPDRLHVAKMRFYFVSDVPAEDGTPVCCYLPYCLYNTTNAVINTTYLQFKTNSTSIKPTGYLASDDMKDPRSASKHYFYWQESSGGESFGNAKHNTTKGGLTMLRLVRKLSMQELEDYKTDFLGYGGKKRKLKVCHKDTYSEWPDYEK